MELIKKNIALIFFSILAVVFSIVYVGYIYTHGGIDYTKTDGFGREFGNMLGTLGFVALAIVYGRSILKIIIGTESFWKRLEPLNLEAFDLKKYSVKLLVLLNKTHAYFGVLAVVLIFLHCFLTGSYRDNLLLQIVLALMALEGISGMVLKIKYTPAQLRQKSYLIHRQFAVGAIIIILAAFGHLILGD
jgi:hypothetical protein